MKITLNASFDRATFDDEGAATIKLNVPSSEGEKVAILAREGYRKNLKITVESDEVTEAARDLLADS